MKGIGLFAAGFASGWVVRSAVGSAREFVLEAVSAARGSVALIKRVAAMERERIEDFIAEANSIWNTKATQTDTGVYQPPTDAENAFQDRAV